MTDLDQVTEDLLKELYSEATPSADYHELVRKKKEGDKEIEKPYYAVHYLPEDKQNEIVQRHVEDLKRWERGKVKFSVLLGPAPTSIKEKVNENRRQEGLEEI